MAKKQKPVSEFKLSGERRDHLRALAHRSDDKARCDYVEALVREVLPKVKVDSDAEAQG